MRTRILSAAVLAPIAIGLTIAGGTPFLIGVAVMCALAAWEAAALFGRAAGLETSWSWRALTALCAGLAVLAIAATRTHPGAGQAALMLALLGSLLALVLGGAPARRAAQWACGVATLAYVAALGAHFVLLRATTQGLWWVLFACAITWCTDIGAFFAGRRFGAHPFFQAISPKKTLEGAVGGLLAGCAVAVLVAAVAGIHVPAPAALGIGATVSAGAQMGDLFESLLKREAGVKDSGTLIPGHGGMLDRIDSLLVAVTIVYYWRLLFP